MSTSWLESCQQTLTLEPAAWVLGRLDAMGIGLEIDARVRGEIAADRPNRTLIVSPELVTDWKRMHWRVTRGCLYLTGGESWAPEFAARPPLPATRVFGRGHSAVVVPLSVRRAW